MPDPLLSSPHAVRAHDPPLPAWLHLGILLGQHLARPPMSSERRAVHDQLGVRTDRIVAADLLAWMRADTGAWVALVEWTQPGAGERLGGGAALRTVAPAGAVRARAPGQEAEMMRRFRRADDLPEGCWEEFR